MSQAGESGLEPFAYQPALDGVRAVAVTLVLLFHAGFGWMSGGYVGVSVFFTLSGYLITSLLLREVSATGTVRLRTFWSRRARRLIPASIVCIVGVAVCARVGWFTAASSLRRDLTAALMQVANWNALLGHVSYADMVARTLGHAGPVDHFWSLAIEEQFYWCWPLLFVVVARGRSLGSVRRRLMVLAAAGVVLAFVVAGVWGADAAYWATPARLGEILVGAAVAAWLHERSVADWWRWLALGGVAVVVWCAVMWPSAGGPAYSGWLPVFAFATVALIVGLQGAGPIRRLLSVRPLVALGRISYGVYLFHWPVFTMLDRQRLDVSTPVLTLVRCAVTLAVSLVSYRLLEMPIRRSAVHQRRVLAVATTGMGLAAVAVWLVVPPSTVVAIDDTALPSAFGRHTTVPIATAEPTTVTAATGATSTTLDHPNRPRRVLLLGDSTMVGLAQGVFDWADRHRNEVDVASIARIGCGVMRGSRLVGDGDGRFDLRCEHLWNDELPASLLTGIPDTAVIMVTLPDVSTRLWNAAEGPIGPSDPRFAARLVADYERLYQLLRGAGVAHIVWVVPPLPAHQWLGWLQPSVGPTDWAPMNRSIIELGREHADVVDVLRFDEWITANEPRDGAWRYDGLHFDEASATAIVDRYLGAALLRGQWGAG